MTFRNDLAKWIHITKEEWRTSQQLKALGPEERAFFVAEQLFHLNHYALTISSRSFKATIYELKNKAIEHFYRAGYAIATAVHTQERECFYCKGDGSCFHCDGSGIYSRTTLYYFIFRINGQVYAWHQPERYVTWRVNLTTADGRSYEERERKTVPDGYKPLASLAALRIYLKWFGMLDYKIPSPFKIQIRKPWWMRMVGWRLMELKGDIKHWWRYSRNSEKEVFIEEDDLIDSPF